MEACSQKSLSKKEGVSRNEFTLNLANETRTIDEIARRERKNKADAVGKHSLK